MKKNFNKISPTSVYCARIRMKHGIPYAKEIIKLIDGKYKDKVRDIPDYRNSLKAKSDFISFIEGRYYSINKVLECLKDAFIVEIAAGLSPRSLNFLSRKDIIYTETDIPLLIRIKEKIIRDIIKEKALKVKSNINFLPLNPLNKVEIKKLGKIYKNTGKGKKLIIVHEGLLMYFNKKEKKVFRDNIKYLFENYAIDGLWITTDLSRLKTHPGLGIGKENIRKEISKITERRFNFFNSKKEIKKFLNEGGLRFNIISNRKIVNKLIKKKGLDFNKKEILKLAEEYCVYLIQLKKQK